MLIEIKNRSLDGSYTNYYLDNEMFIVETMEGKEMIDCSFEDRFNTLAAIFALKENWVSQGEEYDAFQIYFKDGDKEELYNFGRKLPDNFILVLSYIMKLLGANV
jgi:hypothetical protein